MRQIVKNSTDQSVVIRILDSTTGLPEEAVEHDTSGIALWYRREGATKTAITPAALAALDTAHSDGGIEHIDDGYYRLDLPDAAVATGVDGVMVGGTVTGMVIAGVYVELVAAKQTGDSYARLGAPAGASVSADVAAVKSDSGDIKTKTDCLPSATAGAAGGVFIAGTNAPVTITGAGDALSLISTSSGNGLYVGGNGDDAAAFYTSGSGYSGIAAVNTLGYGVKAQGATGMYILGNLATGKGLHCNGSVDIQADEIDAILEAISTNGVVLADDAITAAKFDESTAFPLKSADTGATAVARTGADSDTLETLSDEISDKTGFKLAADGLDSITTTSPDGAPDNFRERLLWLYRRFFNKTTRTATKINHYNDAGDTVLLEQTISDSEGTETMGAADEPA